MKSSFEESTKIHSASELNEMVRRAKSEPAPEFEEDEHTMIGNSAELAAQSMSVPDDAPAPRASSNVIRRTAPAMVVHVTSEPPHAAALATPSDVVELDVDEDDAFAAWDDAGQRTAPQSPDHLVALKEVTPAPSVDVPARIEARALRVEEDVEPSRVEMRLPAPIVMMPPPEISKPGKLRMDRIVAIVVAAVLIAVIALGYRRISALEDELAATKAALEAATARSPAR